MFSVGGKETGNGRKRGEEDVVRAIWGKKTKDDGESTERGGKQTSDAEQCDTA